MLGIGDWGLGIGDWAFNLNLLGKIKLINNYLHIYKYMRIYQVLTYNILHISYLTILRRNF